MCLNSTYQSVPIELGPNPGVSMRESTNLDRLCFNSIVSISDSFLQAKGLTERGLFYSLVLSNNKMLVFGINSIVD